MTINYHTGISFGANPSYEGYSFWDDYSHSTLVFRINGSSNYSYKYYWQYTNTTGYYSDTNSAHFVPNTSTSYGSWVVTGNRSGWRGLSFSDGGNSPHLMFDGSANGGVYFESGGRWASYYSYGNNCWGFGTSSTNSAYNLYAPTGIYSGGRVDGTIFYDTNNTGYYLDPNSTTSLRTVGDWRADSSTWTGEFAGKIQYHSNNWYFQYTTEFIFRNASGSNVFYGDSSGNTYASASHRAPIFYDSNNTGYYADLNNTTYCYYLQSATSVRADSDRRIKDNIEKIENALDKVTRLQGVSFTRKDLEDKKKKYIGLIAQDVLEVIPEVVSGSEESRYSVGYSELVAVLIEAVKEQQTYIKEQDARIVALENKLK